MSTLTDIYIPSFEVTLYIGNYLAKVKIFFICSFSIAALTHISSRTYSSSLTRQVQDVMCQMLLKCVVNIKSIHFTAFIKCNRWHSLHQLSHIIIQNDSTQYCLELNFIKYYLKKDFCHRKFFFMDPQTLLLP